MARTSSEQLQSDTYRPWYDVSGPEAHRDMAQVSFAEAMMLEELVDDERSREIQQTLTTSDPTAEFEVCLVIKFDEFAGS